MVLLSLLFFRQLSISWKRIEHNNDQGNQCDMLLDYKKEHSLPPLVEVAVVGVVVVVEEVEEVVVDKERMVEEVEGVEEVVDKT